MMIMLMLLMLLLLLLLIIMILVNGVVVVVIIIVGLTGRHSTANVRPGFKRYIPRGGEKEGVWGGGGGGAFSKLSHTSDLKIVIPLASLPGIIGSALELVGPMSVHCEWVR